MFPWIWWWAPQVHFPLSGDVAQRIDSVPHLFFQGIKPGAGNSQIEERAFSVASYGKQLGLITDVLIALAEQSNIQSGEAGESLQKLKAIRDEIDAIKNVEYHAMAVDIADQVRALQNKSGGKYAQLVERLVPLLEGGDTKKATS